MGVFLESKNFQVIMKTICVLLSLVAAASAFETCGQKGTGSRITGGVPAGHGEFPWQISLRFGRYGHICGGTLIGNQWVLCAAHCFGQTKNPSAYTVRIGEWKLKANDGTEKDHKVAELHVHNRYNMGKQFNNDIPLMKLAAPVDFNTPCAGPACLPATAQDYRGSQDCILSGWGLVKRWPQTLADQLQKVTGGIWGARELLRQYYSLPDHVVGFGEPGKFSACMGDSGGPLVCRNNFGSFDVIGVVSFGPGTCSGKPGVFTEVSQYRDWLSKIWWRHLNWVLNHFLVYCLFFYFVLK